MWSQIVAQCAICHTRYNRITSEIIMAGDTYKHPPIKVTYHLTGETYYIE